MNTIMQKITRYVPDKVYLQLMYFKHFKKFINFSNPKTYNEKLQWLKLNDRQDIYTTMVDKYLVKQYVTDIIGGQYIIPTLGVWNTAEDIDFDSLPDKFVLKWNHDSGSVIICKNKQMLDRAATIEKLNKSKSHNGYWYAREWPYKNVNPCIIAEQYMEDSKTSELRDYKFFCFNGVAKALFVASERQKKGEEVKFDFFDMDFKHLKLRQGHPNAKICPEKPETFEEMKYLAEKLSKNIPQLRVDFYEVDGRVYFGELTFSHFAGMVPFEPKEWDETMGSWIALPNQK
ncbi:MAG: glycosyl transferase [Clostridia bacterium]|nr:glycosyl transferase [Clostridia bacterium]